MRTVVSASAACERVREMKFMITTPQGAVFDRYFPSHVLRQLNEFAAGCMSMIHTLLKMC